MNPPRFMGATKDISEPLERARKEISILREYCPRLIAEIAAGRLDVRDAALGRRNVVVEEQKYDDESDKLGGAERVADQDHDFAFPEEIAA